MRTVPWNGWLRLGSILAFLLAGLACRSPLLLPDRSAPVALVLAVAEGIEEGVELRADLVAAFGSGWEVVPQGAPAPPDRPVLTLHIDRFRLGSASSGGNRLLGSGGVILGLATLALWDARGWDALMWIPVGSVAIPLVVTGVVQKVKSRIQDARRGYPLPELRARVSLRWPEEERPGECRIDAQDFRELAESLGAAEAQDPRAVRRACAEALARWVARESGRGRQ